MNTAIVILNYNTYQMTLDYVENLIENFGNQVKIIVVDNASTNESAEVLERESENRGFIFIPNKIMVDMRRVTI